jgi:recombination protein RecA
LEEGTGDDKQYTGNRVKVKIVKNKVAPPFKTAEFDIMYNKGISRLGDLIDLGVKYEVIKKAGAFYSYGENKIGQGRENTRAFLTLKENEKIAKNIEKDVLEVVRKFKDADNGSVAEEPTAAARPISKSAKAQAPVQE